MIKIIDHVTLTIGDLERSRKFYTEILGEPTSSDDEHSCFKLDNGLFCIALPPKQGYTNDRFDENRIGLDHLAFGVENITSLKELERKIRKLNVMTSGIEVVYGNKHKLTFRDPDNIQVEFFLR